MAKREKPTAKADAGAPPTPAPANRSGRPSALLDTRLVYCGDNIEQLAKLPDACVDLTYIDPPLNSNRNYEVFWGETKEKRSPRIAKKTRGRTSNTRRRIRSVFFTDVKSMTYSFLDFAYDVLKTATKPLTYQEVWMSGLAQGHASKLNTSGKTPDQSVGAQLYVDVRDNDESRFIKVGKRPARFFLKEREGEIPVDAISKLEKEEVKKPEPKSPFHERDLHPLLTYFAYSNIPFNRGRAVHTKTVYHESSKKPGFNEWVYPDIVGFYVPIDEWDDAVIEINRLCDNNSLRLFSFELKKVLNKANYRESFFQAVSNSSWAHEGYLVAADVLQDDDFLAELQRLAASFGIGVIHLDLDDIDASGVIFPARQRERLDWDTINKLCEQNGDFKKFLKHVKIDFQAKTLHKSEYDEILKDVPAYLKSKGMMSK